MTEGALIGVALWGLFFGLICGYVSCYGRPPIRGWRARIIGLVALMPLLLAWAIGYLWAAVAAQSGQQLDLDKIRSVAVIIDLSLAFTGLVTIQVLKWWWSRPPADAPGGDSSRHIVS